MRGKHGRTPWALVTHIFGKMGGFKEAVQDIVFEDQAMKSDAVNKAIEIKQFDGETGNSKHLTRREVGNIPLAWLRNLRGKMGEKRGEHRNRLGTAWDEFKSDIAAHGIKNPILVIVDYDKEPFVYEGNHRIDAAIELGMKTIPGEIRYFGNSQDQGTIEARHSDLQGKRRSTK